MSTQSQEKAFRLKPEHIREEWSEGHPKQGGDGYWIALRRGWCWTGEPCGGLHTIHEDTKTKAHQQTVMRCHCKDCQ